MISKKTPKHTHISHQKNLAMEEVKIMATYFTVKEKKM